MSQANVELVWRTLDLYEKDESAWLELLDSDVEWTPFEEGFASVGHEQALRIRRQWLDSWERHEIDVEDVIDAGDQVIAALHLIGRGKASGVQVDVRLYIRYTVGDGRILSIFEHTDMRDALHAAGVA